MRTLENQMRIFLRLFTIFGQFPLSICDTELVPSNLLKFYGVIVMLIQVTIASLVMSTDLAGDSLAAFALRCLPGIGILEIIATITMPILNSNLICEVYERFNKVDRYFRELGIALREQDNIYPPFVTLLSYSSYTAVIIATEYIFPFWITNIGNYAVLFNWLVIVMTTVVISCNTYSHWLSSRYKVINEELRKIERGLKLKGAANITANMIYDVHSIGSCFETHEREIFPPYGNRVHHLKKSLKKCQVPISDMVVKIKKLQKSHYELSEICGSLGGIFTPSIIFAMLFTGCELLITAYTGLGMIINSSEIGTLALATCVKWVVIDFIRIVCVLKAFTAIEKVGNMTPSHVHGLLLEMDDAEAQKELMKFSQQLSHQKINFSTCGFFSLDMSLLVSMTGAITTYLVILLQFSPNANNASGNAGCTNLTPSSTSTTTPSSTSS